MELKIEGAIQISLVPIKKNRTSCLNSIVIKRHSLYQVKPTINDTKNLKKMAQISTSSRDAASLLNQNEIVAIPRKQFMD
jgi:hypothetical protein